MADKILVTGASGNLGGLIVKHLLERGVAADRIIAGSRSTDKLADLAAKGIETRQIDFNETAGLEKAFSGADTVLIVSTDALDAQGTRLKQHQAAVKAAVAAGVKRLAYTSLPSPDTSKVSFAPDHLGTEKAIEASGLPYIIFRNTWYQENLFMGLPTAFKSGNWYSSAGEGRTAYAAREDIADAIAAALANPPAANTVYTLTGTEAFTSDEVASLAAKATGKPLQVVHITDEQLAGGMKAAGVPEAFIPTLVSFDTATRAGDLGEVTGDIEKLTGKPARKLADFIAAAKDQLSAS